ncbi:hypothetical protein LOC68_09590 [Blastopirellula sp. JC732]|uniref:Uncharacterized protein n=1 Tax=Blastopirellula sediminis TaxID=2894196 RepID=A0A9X1MLX6_9BACT|nr:hypothetical protein [Blastopirellula sediminis]MCC9608573.1 hypothetical protein [Blastopirellula sediminis]MCC9628650.1 hypothetical protein [Blastopirellula sediminis]
MFRSIARTDNAEFELARDLRHIEDVWNEIATGLPVYWQKFLDRLRPPASDVIEILGARVQQEPSTQADGVLLVSAFDVAVEEFESEAAKYREFFDEGAIEEYEEDPNAFKHLMTRELPVIARTLRQSNKELKEWQKKFRLARPADLLAVFTNVLDFYDEWSANHSVVAYKSYNAPAEFQLAPINDDENLNIPGVIGMGIKTIVLFHKDPQRMPQLGRFALFGLYFLSGRKSFGMISDSSEFLMINDETKAANGSFVMDQNYWYPYDVFSLYLLRIYRWISSKAAEQGFGVDDQRRYVYVERFLEAVCAEHLDDMKTMRAHDSFGIPA